MQMAEELKQRAAVLAADAIEEGMVVGLGTGSTVAFLLDEVARRADSFVADLLEYVRIPSVSTDPGHAPDLHAAARWTAQRLERAGVTDVRTLPTAGHPVVATTTRRSPP